MIFYDVTRLTVIVINGSCEVEDRGRLGAFLNKVKRISLDLDCGGEHSPFLGVVYIDQIQQHWNISGWIWRADHLAQFGLRCCRRGFLPGILIFPGDWRRLNIKETAP